MFQKKLHFFKYKFDKGNGPLPLSDLQIKNIQSGNCRLQVQDYFYTVHNLYLKPEQILLPKAYKEVGEFVTTGKNDHFFDTLQRGDIIYAEKYRNKKGEVIYKEKNKFTSEDEWILYFHTAIFLGILDKEIEAYFPSGSVKKVSEPVILHSSFISEGSVVWTVNTFLHYYQPVAAKRIIK